MATFDEIEFDYDDTNDVVYASLGAPKPALSYEMLEDILFRYIPPNPEVVGITIMNFLEHYPVHDKATIERIAKTIVQELLGKYPCVPRDEVLPVCTAPSPWRLSCSSAAAGAHPDNATKYLGHPTLLKSPDIQWSPVPEKDKVS